MPKAYWAIPLEELLRELGTSASGLGAEEAAARLAREGPNRWRRTGRNSAMVLLLAQLRNPLLLILLGAAIVSAYVQEWVDAILVLGIIAGSAVLSFLQEYTASRAIEELRKKIRTRCRVLRDAKPIAVDADMLARGDVLLLGIGSLVPADAVVIEAENCLVDQAVLSGESFPAEKRAGVVAEDSSLAARLNCLYSGSSVRSGWAKAVVVATGGQTAYGQIAEHLVLRPPESKFEEGIRRFGYLLTQVMLALVLVVFAINVFAQKPPVESLLFSIALAVGLAPELLPAILSITLARGAKMMARRGVIVRRLNSIENFGGMDILCSDKTGTLTEGRVRLEGAYDVDGKRSAEVQRLAYWNAAQQSGLQNVLDEAILEAGSSEWLAGLRKVGELPYDFERKRLSVIVEAQGGETVLVCKGALHSVRQVCVEEGQGERVEESFRQWSAQGYRVLGVARRSFCAGEIYREEELRFAGFLLFFDPPKQGVAQTLADLDAMGVRVKLITGDNELVSAHVAAQVGLRTEPMLTGAQIRAMPDEALWHLAEKTSLFVDVDPNQKERIILALQKMGHVVGYLGDGINDAPALHAADVGISVDSAVDVAKESADLVLLEHDLEVLRQGIAEGRRTFANTLKYIFTTTSANFGNMLSMAAASLFLPFLPLLASQILLNNFLSDIPGMAIASDRVDADWTEKPHRWDLAYIRNFMLLFGLLSSVFDTITFGVLLWGVQASMGEFRTAWFVESLLTELAVALVVRTKLHCWRSRPGRGLWISSAVVAGVALAIPYLPFATTMGFVALPPALVGVVILISLSYVLSAEILKRYFYGRYSLTAGREEQ